MCAMSISDATPAFGPALRRGPWVLREAAGAADMSQLLALRARVFRGDAGASDADAQDPHCRHLWIGRPEGPPLATLRLRHHPNPASLRTGYCAGYFDMGPLGRAPGTALELGRLCLAPEAAQVELMRLVWTGIARMVAQAGAARMIGCTSLPGDDPAAHRPVLARLARRHLGPATLRPRPGPVAAISLSDLRMQHRDAQEARLPPILRSYVALGGWVSDVVAIDRDLGTCLVFTCVEVASMPDDRRRLLHKLAGLEASGARADRWSASA